MTLDPTMRLAPSSAGDELPQLGFDDGDSGSWLLTLAVIAAVATPAPVAAQQAIAVGAASSVEVLPPTAAVEETGWSVTWADNERQAVISLWMDDGSGVPFCPPEEVAWAPPPPQRIPPPPILAWADNDEWVPEAIPVYGGGFHPGLTSVRIQSSGDEYVEPPPVVYGGGFHPGLTSVRIQSSGDDWTPAGSIVDDDSYRPAAPWPARQPAPIADDGVEFAVFVPAVDADDPYAPPRPWPAVAPILVAVDPDQLSFIRVDESYWLNPIRLEVGGPNWIYQGWLGDPTSQPFLYQAYPYRATWCGGSLYRAKWKG